jgi:hypothetical protein
MTNAEKYLKDGETGNFVQAFSCWYYGITRELENADKMLVQFLKAETKPTLTDDERVKEMVYTKEHKREVLATGYYFGLLYYVLSMGTHPTAYVKIPKDNWLCTVKDYDAIPVKCHGGLTFRDDHLYIADNQKIEGESIGWDYAHCDDYAPYYEDLPNLGLAEKSKKWTTHEILKEVKEVCSQIVELGKKPHLTEDERVILKNLKSIHNVIGRNRDGNIQLMCKEPRIKDCIWHINLSCYNHLFQFIEERRRI